MVLLCGVATRVELKYATRGQCSERVERAKTPDDQGLREGKDQNVREELT